MLNWIRQSAAIPVRAGKVCLISSSSGKRWVIPKGMIDPGKTAGEMALQEAWEEAGIVGSISSEPVGSYVYRKWSGTCHVTVYLMQVTEILDEWPEAHRRQRIWVPFGEACDRVDETGLRDLLHDVASRLELAPRAFTIA